MTMSRVMKNKNRKKINNIIPLYFLTFDLFIFMLNRLMYVVNVISLKQKKKKKNFIIVLLVDSILFFYLN